MAKVLDTATQQVVDVPDSEVTALVASGKALLPKGDIPVVDSRGVAGTIPSEDAAGAFGQGYRFRPAAEVQAELERETYEDRPLAAGTAAAARAVTLGASDAFLTEIGAVRPETLRGLEDYNEEASVGGEVLGTAGALLLSGGSATPVAVGERVAARVGTAAAERLGGRALAREAVRGGVEGGLQGLGRAVTDAAQERDSLTAEKAVASVASGALFGLGTGALFGKAEDLVRGRGQRLAGEVGEALPPTTPPGGERVPPQGVPPAGPGAPPTGPAGGGGGGTPPGGGGGGGTPPGGPPSGGGTPPGGGGEGPDIASVIAGKAAATAKPLKEAIEKNPGVFQRAFDALDLNIPDADEFVLRGLDAKKQQLKVLREKGLDKAAPRALREDPRFAQVKNQDDAAALVAVKLEESGNQVRAQAQKLDELVSPEDQLDVDAFVARAESELVAPLARGTVDERRAARRMRQELRALADGVQAMAPAAPAPRKAGVVVEVPLSELDDVPAKANRKGAVESAGRELDKGGDVRPIKVGQGEDGLRELSDGNHLLVAARARGLKSVRVLFDSEEAAAIAPRKRGTSVFRDATAPMDSPDWKPSPLPAPRKLLTFAQAEELKRRLDKSLRWDSTTPNEVRDQLRQLRALLNAAQEETAERVSKKLGTATFSEWKKAKQEFGQMTELDKIVQDRLQDAKVANRVFSLTDNLAGMVGAIAGGGVNPAGLGLALGSALLNKWGRESLPFVMARAMARFDGDPGAQKAARALMRKLKGRGPGGGAAPGAAPAPRPPTGPASPGGAGGARTPEAVDEALLGTIRRAAQQGPAETWLTHTLLSGATEYRELMERQGLANFSPEADAEGARRAATMTKAEEAAARFDARANAATIGLLSRKRPGLKPLTRSEAIRKAEEVLAAAKEPEALVARVADRLSAVGADVPGLASEMQATAQRAHTFLASKAPARPVSPLGDVPALRRGWKPSEVELARWSAYVRAVEDPASVLEDAAGGRLAAESVEALAAVYPALLQDVRGRVLDQLITHPELLDYGQRLALGQLLGMELDESMAPGVVANIQAMYAQQPEKPQGRPAASVARNQKLHAAEFSPSDAINLRSV